MPMGMVFVAGGEGGIRTHGGLTPTTVFETVDVHAVWCHLVSFSVVWYGKRRPFVTSSTILYRPVSLSWFANGLQNAHESRETENARLSGKRAFGSKTPGLQISRCIRQWCRYHPIYPGSTWSARPLSSGRRSGTP